MAPLYRSRASRYFFWFQVTGTNVPDRSSQPSATLLNVSAVPSNFQL
jgi:hypothetical protein